MNDNLLQSLSDVSEATPTNIIEERSGAFINISDFFGAKVPMAKLLSVIEKGAGRVTTSYFTRKKADAKAYEINVVGKALIENADKLDKIEYKSEGLIMVSTNTPQERALARKDYQELKRQENIEKITSFAGQELTEIDNVSEEQVDEDWIRRFFNIAEDVSNEDMQLLWGKILAGEVRRPKTFSLRTLEILKNISSDEASIFKEVSKYFIECEDAIMIVRDLDFLRLKDITFRKIMKLQEVGLLGVINELHFKFDDPKTVFTYGSYVIDVEHMSMANQGFEAIALTQAGIEIFYLLQRETDFDYIKNIALNIKKNASEDIIIKWGVVTEKDSEGGIKLNSIIE